MKTDRYKLYAKLHILITQTGADKEALYSSYGVTSASQMSDYDLIDCIDKLEGKTPHTAKAKTSELEIRRMRSEVLSLLTKSPSARDTRKRGLGIPNDWEVLNPWIERHAGKRLSYLSIGELATFKRQMLALRAKGWIWREPKSEIPPHQVDVADILYGMPIVVSRTIS